jgi:hypothetical protein
LRGVTPRVLYSGWAPSSHRTDATGRRGAQSIGSGRRIRLGSHAELLLEKRGEGSQQQLGSDWHLCGAQEEWSRAARHVCAPSAKTCGRRDLAAYSPATPPRLRRHTRSDHGLTNARTAHTAKMLQSRSSGAFQPMSTNCHRSSLAPLYRPFPSRHPRAYPAPLKPSNKFRTRYLTVVAYFPPVASPTPPKRSIYTPRQPRTGPARTSVAICPGGGLLQPTCWLLAPSCAPLSNSARRHLSRRETAGQPATAANSLSVAASSSAPRLKRVSSPVFGDSARPPAAVPGLEPHHGTGTAAPYGYIRSVRKPADGVPTAPVAPTMPGRPGAPRSPAVRLELESRGASSSAGGRWEP